MSELIDRINQADAIAGMWREGRIAFIVVVERLVSDGWYGISAGERGIVAFFRGVRFEL